MKQDLDQRIWLPVVFFIIGFLMAEMPLISRLNNWQNRTDFMDRTLRYLIENFFTPGSAFSLLSIGVAIVSALSGFIYMHSAKKLDVYHSLPVKREILFLQQYAYGVLYYVVPMVLHILICVVICAANGVMNGAVLGSALGFFLVQLLMYLICYSMVVVAVCLTGNLVISVLGSAVLLVYTLVIFWLRSSLMNSFFETYYGMETYGILPLTPIDIIYRMILEMDRADSFAYVDYMGHYGQMLLATVIYTVIALFLYKKRPTEVAGNTMAFPISEPIVKAMIVIPGAMCSGYLFTGIISNNDDFIWFLLGAVFGFAIICALMEIIFRKDMKAILAHPLQFVFNGVCVIGILMILEFDLLGYDTYIPDEDEVESYAIDFGGINTIYSGYGDINYTYRLDNMEITDNPGTRKLLEHAAAYTRPLRRGEMEQEISDGKVYNSSFDVRYNLKNGKTVYRSYLMNLRDEQVMQWLADTCNDIQHKLGTYPILSRENTDSYMGVLVECAYATDEIPLSAEQMQRFVEVYRRDLTNLSFEEMITEYPVADLSFALKEPEANTEYAMEYTTEITEIATKEYITSSNFDYYGEEHGYRIYPSFTQTIALLKEYGAEFATVIPAEDIIDIEITDYSEEVDDHDGLYTKIAEVHYTAEAGQQAQMDEILPNLVANKFVEGFLYDTNTETYIDVDVTYMRDNIEMSQYFKFKPGHVPEFVLEDLEAEFENMEEAAQ